MAAAVHSIAMTTDVDLWDRLQSAVSKVATRTEELGDSKNAFGLWTNALTAAINAGDFEEAIRLYEKVSEKYTAMENPDAWMTNVISSATGRLVALARQRSGDTDPSESGNSE